VRPYYQDDYVTIYHGDCREVLPGLGKVDLVLTDPPYGIGCAYASYDDTADGLDAIIRDVIPLVISAGVVCLITPGVGNICKYPQPRWVLAWHWKACTASGPWGFSTWQPILAYGKDPYLANGKGRTPDSFEHLEMIPKNGHPCPKPETLLRKMILRGSVKQTDTILDPFMGSGTTLRAAKDLQRKAIGIEIEEKYCEIAAKRMAQEVLPL